MKVKRMAVSLSDRTLGRLLRTTLVILLVGVPLFGVIYAFDQRGGSGPTLAERQVRSAELQVRSSPDDITFRLRLAQAYRQAKRYDDALEQYGQVLKVDRANRTALMGRGEALMAKGDLTAAAAAYRKVTSTGSGGEFAGADPQLQEAHYYLASIAMSKGELKKAVTESEAALKIDPTDADAWYLLGTVRLKEGTPDQAVRAFRNALSFVPTGWCEPYEQLGVAHRELGQAGEAEYAAAMVDFCRRRPAEAARRLKALTSGPTEVRALLGLGMVAESTGGRDEAVQWYRKVLAVDARNTSAITGLARLGVGPPKRPGTSSPGTARPTRSHPTGSSTTSSHTAGNS